MAREPRIHAPGALYHVMFRGNGGDLLFSDRDRLGLEMLVSEGVKRFERHIRELGVSKGELSGASRARRLTRVKPSVSFLTLRGGYGTLTELARHFGRDPAAPHRGAARLRGEIKRNADLGRVTAPRSEMCFKSQ
jgi:hypothetical protein